MLGFGDPHGVASLVPTRFGMIAASAEMLPGELRSVIRALVSAARRSMLPPELVAELQRFDLARDRVIPPGRPPSIVTDYEEEGKVTVAERDGIIARIDRAEGRLAEALNLIQWRVIALADRFPENAERLYAAAPSDPFRYQKAA